MIDAFCAQSWETVEIPQLQLVLIWTVVACPVVCNDRCPWSMAQFIDGCERPCDHAATVVQWQCLRSLHRQSRGTSSWCNREWYSTFCCGGFGGGAVGGVFGGFSAFFVAAMTLWRLDGVLDIFRAPPLVPELSAS